MTHTIDTLINLIRRYGMACYNQASPEHFDAEAKDAIFLEIHAALIEALGFRPDWADFENGRECGRLEAAQPVRVPLTDEQVDRISKSYGRRYDFARAIQAAHGIEGDV